MTDYTFRIPDEARCQSELPPAKHLPPLTGKWCPNPRMPDGELCAWHIAKRDHTPEPDYEQGAMF